MVTQIVVLLRIRPSSKSPRQNGVFGSSETVGSPPSCASAFPISTLNSPGSRLRYSQYNSGPASALNWWYSGFGSWSFTRVNPLRRRGPRTPRRSSRGAARVEGRGRRAPPYSWYLAGRFRGHPVIGRRRRRGGLTVGRGFALFGFRDLYPAAPGLFSTTSQSNVSPYCSRNSRRSGRGSCGATISIFSPSGIIPYRWWIVSWRSDFGISWTSYRVITPSLSAIEASVFMISTRHSPDPRLAYSQSMTSPCIDRSS